MNRLKLLVAWCCFAAGVALVIVDIVRPPFEPTGVFLLGLIALWLWLLLIGGFHREFWVRDDRYDEPWPLDALEQEGHR